MNHGHRDEMQVAANRVPQLRLQEAERVFESSIKPKGRSNVSWNGFLRLNNPHRNMLAGYWWTYCFTPSA
jgi:hypothetical protein